MKNLFKKIFGIKKKEENFLIPRKELFEISKQNRNEDIVLSRKEIQLYLNDCLSISIVEKGFKTCKIFYKRDKVDVKSIEKELNIQGYYYKKYFGEHKNGFWFDPYIEVEIDKK